MKYATYAPELPGCNITGHYDDGIHAEIPAGAVPVTDEQWQLSCQGRLRIENGVPIEYAPPGPTLDDLKSAKNAEVNAARDVAIDAGIECGGHSWQTDKQARENITGTLAAVTAGVPLPAGFTWRTTDNQDVPMDAAGLTAIAGTVLAHVNACYQQSWQRKAEIDAAADAAAVEAVTW